jgi:cell pole-organizing protein PopZ
MTRQPAPAEVEPAPLELTPAQMVVEEKPEILPARLGFEAMLGRSAGGPAGPTDDPPLVDPEDVTFEPDELAARSAASSLTSAGDALLPREATPPPRAPVPPPRPVPGPARSVAEVAPMPDPTLSSDMAEQLLAPAANAAVKHTFTRLQGMTMAGSGMTLEGLMRDMLRPMLKEWLDENLPAVVERMVEKEIARISRGGE